MTTTTDTISPLIYDEICASYLLIIIELYPHIADISDAVDQAVEDDLITWNESQYLYAYMAPDDQGYDDEEFDEELFLMHEAEIRRQESIYGDYKREREIGYVGPEDYSDYEFSALYSTEE
jgi:hypothetical protein